MAAEIQDSRSARFALRCSNWAERWFPDSWVFAALAVVLVCIGALAMGAKPTDLSLIHISEPTRLHKVSRMPSSA